MPAPTLTDLRPELRLLIAEQLVPDETPISKLSRICTALHATLTPFLYQGHVAHRIGVDRGASLSVVRGRPSEAMVAMDPDRGGGAAAWYGMMAHLLARGADIDTRGHDSDMVLAKCIRESRREQAEWLLERGADVNPRVQERADVKEPGKMSSLLEVARTWSRPADLMVALLEKCGAVDGGAVVDRDSASEKSYAAVVAHDCIFWRYC